MNNKNNKAKKRVKESLISISDAVTREGCSIVPGGGLAYDILKALCNFGKKYYTDRNNQKLKDFHDNLLDGDLDELDFKKFIEKNFSEDDYYSLLANLIQDEETEKVKYYSSLMKSIIKDEVNYSYKSHYIKSIKDLSCRDITTLQYIYISNNNEFEGEGNITEQVKKITGNNEPLTKISIAKLTMFGFLENSDNGLLPTSIIDNFIESIFSKNELNPTTIEKKAIHSVDVFIATFLDDYSEDNRKNNLFYMQFSEKDIIRYNNVLDHIKNILENSNLKFIISNPNKFSLAQKNASLILLCLDKDENPMLTYSWNKELLREDNTVKILLDKYYITKLLFISCHDNFLLKKI